MSLARPSAITEQIETTNGLLKRRLKGTDIDDTREILEGLVLSFERDAKKYDERLTQDILNCLKRIHSTNDLLKFFVRQHSLILLNQAKQDSPDLFNGEKAEAVEKELTEFFYAISSILSSRSTKSITLDELQKTADSADHAFISYVLDNSPFMRQIDDAPTYEFIYPLYHRFFANSCHEEVAHIVPKEWSPLQTQPVVALFGDSALDNQSWVGRGGYLWNRLKEWLGIARDSIKDRLAQAKRTYFKTELTVVENTIEALPAHTVKNYANYGFTTAKVLSGCKRNTAFAGGMLKLSYPDEFFSPLKAAQEEIKEGPACVVLSIGGDNFKEFLEQVRGARNRKDYIQANYKTLLADIRREYRLIVKSLRHTNPLAKIILMTPAYPSTVATFDGFYPLIQEIGRALGLGINPNNALDVIHAIMKEIYSEIFAASDEFSVVVADVTSSLDPFDGDNHTRQMGPSGAGGRKIAQMLSYIIPQPFDSGKVYRFLPGFFTSPTEHNNVERCELQKWRPKHPYEFTGAACYDTRAAIRSLEIEKEEKGKKTKDEKNGLTDTEYEEIEKNEKLRHALIVLQQISEGFPHLPRLITRQNFRRLLRNDLLQGMLAAAHGYINSGHFGWFRMHHTSGITETANFIHDLMNDPTIDDETVITKEGVMQFHLKHWLINSGTHHSSRLGYASKLGLLSSYDPKIEKNYATATRAERQLVKNIIFSSRN